MKELTKEEMLEAIGGYRGMFGDVRDREPQRTGDRPDQPEPRGNTQS